MSSNNMKRNRATQVMAQALESFNCMVGRVLRSDSAVQRALQDSEAKYRELYENLPDMCATVDGQSETITECNETFARELGYSKAEIIGRSLRGFYQSDVVNEADLEKLRRSEGLRDHERVFERKDGTSLEVSMSVIVAKDIEGRPCAKAVWRDISVRKRAERDRRFAAELSEIPRVSPSALDLMAKVAERVGMYLNASRASFIEVDVQNDRMSIRADYHPGAASMAGTFALTGYSSENRADQQAGRTTVVTDTSADPRTAAKFESAYKPWGTRSSVAVPLLRDGIWIASLVVADAVPRVWDEREVELIKVLAERAWLWVEHLRLGAVVREKEARELVRQSEEHFRTLVESVKDYAIFMLDAKGYIKTWNRGAERIKGYSEAEIIGKHISVFYPAEDIARGHPEDLLRRAVADGRYAEEGWRVRKDGSRFWASVLLTPLHGSDGTLQGFAKVTHDQSARRQADEVLRDRQAQLTVSLNEREVLLQEVHHRVKNNLQVISSLINLQKRKMVDVEARRGLSECSSRIEAIAMIHEKLYQSSDYASVSFFEYARSLAASIFRAAQVSPDSIALKVEADRIALAVDQAVPCGLILNELITNALKHAFPGERHGRIHVELRKQETQLVLTVEDDGVGMPHDFDLGSSKSLGLHLVTTLVKQLHAQLEIVQRGGTLFRVTFPLKRSA